MERWLVRKKKELSQKRKRQKSQNIIVITIKICVNVKYRNKIHNKQKKEQNKVAFRKWLRRSLGDLKIEKLKTKEIEREKELK